MTSPKTLRWGLIGAARIAASALVPALRATGSTMVAVGCRDVERGAAFAAMHGIAHVDSYEGVLGRDDIDAVYIALPNHAHLPLTLAALAAGKHVLCEKPLALNAAEVAQMQRASAASGKLVLEAFMYRFHPQIDRLRELIATAALGRLKWLRGSFTYSLRDMSDVRWDPALGGGALYDLGCYPLSLMRLLTQAEPEVLNVASRLTDPAIHNGSVDHAAHATLRFETAAGRVFGHLDCAFSLPFMCHFEALCEDGILRLDVPFAAKNVESLLMRGDVAERFAPCDPYALMVAHFEAAAQGEAPLRWSLAEAHAQAVAMDRLLALAMSSPTA